MTKDKKELEALSSLCAENNVLMVRSFLPDDIRRKRRNLKSGIQQFKGSLWVLRQIRHYIQGYKNMLAHHLQGLLYIYLQFMDLSLEL